MFRTSIINSLLTIVILLLNVQAMTAMAQTPAKLVVYTVNYPLQYFGERIAGELLQIEFPGPSGVDPALWTPDEKTLLEYQKADLILVNGANYAKWLNTVSLPINRIVNTTRHLQNQYMYSDDVAVHTHGPEGKHSHNNLAFTTWLDMTIALEQARSVAAAFSRLLPEHNSTFMHNLDKLADELNQLDAEIQTIRQAFGDKPVLASHPVYQYFSRRYRFNLQSIHWEPEQTPPLAQWQGLELLLEKHLSHWMLWEAPPNNETTEGLLKVGINPVVFNTLANRPLNGNFISIMKENIRRLKAINN